MNNLSPAVRIWNPQWNGYQSVMRNIPEKCAEVETQISMLSNLDQRISRVAQCLQSDQCFGMCDPSSDPYDFLAALQREKISQGQFATSCIYASLKESVPQGATLECVPLFTPDGEISQRAKKEIAETLPQSCSADFENKWDQFFSEMQTLPASERQYFILRGAESRSYGIFAVVSEVGITPFGVTHSKERMVPSFGMMCAFLRGQCGQDAVTPIPGIGLSPLESLIQNGLEDEREFGIPFADLPFPDKADGYPLTYRFDFCVHDWYHAIRASRIPLKVRRAWIELALHVRQLIDKTEESLNRSDINYLFERLVDMDLIYPTSQKSTESETFMATLQDIVMQVYAAARSLRRVPRSQMEREARAFYNRLCQKITPSPGTLLDELFQKPIVVPEIRTTV